MKNLQYFIIIFCGLLFFSCSHRNDSIKGKYGFQIEPFDDTLFLSGIFGNAEILQLKGRVISNIKGIIMLDSTMIIRCNAYESIQELSGSSAISLFSRGGMFINSIVRIGRGPDEVLTVEDMCINEYCGTLDVLCNYGQSIYQYDLDSFSLVNKIDIDKDDIVVANSLVPINSSDYLLYKQYPYSSHQDYKLYVYDSKENRVEASFIEMDERLAENLAFSQDNNLFEYGGDIYYYEAFGSAVYVYTGNEVTPWAVFEENRYTLPDKVLSEAGSNLPKFVQTLEGSGYVWGQINLFRYGQYLFSTYMYGNQCFLCVMDMDKGVCRSYSSIKDDMLWDVVTNDVRGVFTLSSADENCLVYVVEPYVMKELVASQPEEKTGMRDMLMQLPDDANPLLVVMK